MTTNIDIHNLEPDWHQLGIGPAPDHLIEEAKVAWNDLIDMAPPGKWLRMDKFMLEIAANCIVEYRLRKPTDEEMDVLADVLARMLLGPEHFEKLIGVPYPRPWPDQALVP